MIEVFLPCTMVHSCCLPEHARNQAILRVYCACCVYWTHVLPALSLRLVLIHRRAEYTFFCYRYSFPIHSYNLRNVRLYTGTGTYRAYLRHTCAFCVWCIVLEIIYELPTILCIYDETRLVLMLQPNFVFESGSDFCLWCGSGFSLWCRPRQDQTFFLRLDLAMDPD